MIAAFVSATAVPGVLALGSGVFADGGSRTAGAKRASQVFRVASLSWPAGALGLASTASLVGWQQRTSGALSSGLWAYDVRTQRPVEIVSAGNVGLNAGPPSMSAGLVAWSAKAPGSKHEHTVVKAFDRYSGRLFTVTGHGTLPRVSGTRIVWVTHAGDGRGTHNGWAVLNALTDDRYAVATSARVRELAVCGPWVTWVAGSSSAGSVWATRDRGSTRHELAAAGSHVAIDGRRIVWSRRTRDGETAIVAWNLRSAHSKVLCRVDGAVSSLSLAANLAVWRRSTHGGEIWAYDFNRHRAYVVSAGGGEQAGPVLVGHTAYWADKRSGQWELYGRALQP